MRYLDEQAIEYIALGAALLGTGGGGDPYIGKMMALSAIKTYGKVQLIEPMDVPDDAWVSPVAGIGAPSVLVEKIPNGSEFKRAFEALSRYIGQEIFATLPIEAGGVNSMIPIVVAAECGIPLIDVDGMGRAFPELQMVTFHLHGVSATPLALTDEKGNLSIIEAIDNQWTERLARAMTVEMGAHAEMCIYPMQGKMLKLAGIANVVTLSEKIGKIIHHASEIDQPLAALLELTQGINLFSGKIIDVERQTRSGFNYGKVIIEGLDTHKHKTMEVYFQNENLVALCDGIPVALTPDLICIVQMETLVPVTTDALKYGTRVHVLGLPAHSQWRTQKGIEVAGPRYFGYEYDYIPLEILNAKEVV